MIPSNEGRSWQKMAEKAHRDHESSLPIRTRKNNFFGSIHLGAARRITVS